MIKNLKRLYHPYHKWECYKNGMWDKLTKKDELILLPKAIIFTSNHVFYGNAMNEVLLQWTYSMENFLSNVNINRKAYIGHAAVSYRLKIPEYITRLAWKELTDKQRLLANKEAEKAIKTWEQNQKLNNTLKTGKESAITMDCQMRLQLN
jgi:hypothetical protein